MLASRPCQAIGQRTFRSANGVLPVRRPAFRARVAAIDPVVPAQDERGFRLKEVSEQRLHPKTHKSRSCARLLASALAAQKVQECCRSVTTHTQVAIFHAYPACWSCRMAHMTSQHPHHSAWPTSAMPSPRTAGRRTPGSQCHTSPWMSALWLPWHMVLSP